MNRKRGDLRSRLANAVRHFWMKRKEQESRQGAKTGRRDQGGRSAVTGGAQMDGYLMLLEEAPESTNPVRVSEPHFKVFEEFRDSSYAKRYEFFCQKLVRERLYDAACFLLSDRRGGMRGRYKEPSVELSFENFAASLTGRTSAYAKLRSSKGNNPHK
jgi:hypothetical protein